MLKINYRATGDLIPYVNNSRTHNEAQVQQVAASIKEFGFTNPILLDDDSGIIAGHGRLLAAQKLNLDKVPTITLKGLTEAQRKAYVIADNQLALNSGWDYEALRIEVDRIAELDFDISLLGFDDDFLDDLLIDGDAVVDFPEMDDGDKEPFQQITYTLHDEQAEIVRSAVTLARTNPVVDTGLNDNANGNAIALICEQWLNANS
ncbi:MAG: ParB/Srx family N-terminal domain-containing protein [Pseudoalteromonas tetraodonis]